MYFLNLKSVFFVRARNCQSNIHSCALTTAIKNVSRAFQRLNTKGGITSSYIVKGEVKNVYIKPTLDVSLLMPTSHESRGELKTNFQIANILSPENRIQWYNSKVISILFFIYYTIPLFSLSSLEKRKNIQLDRKKKY